MITSHEFANAVGREKLASAFGVGMTAVSNAIVRGQFPSSWYNGSKGLASDIGIECPPELFGQKSLPNAQTQTGAA